MSGSDGVGFDRLPILVELREQLNQHYRASASSPREQPLCVRARRWRPLALIAVLVLGGATGALAAAGVFTPSVIQRASTYISPGAMRAVNSPLCAPRPLTMATGTPPASLLSILGVLRRPERTGGIPDVLSRRLVPPQTGLYVRYVRFARSADWADYYVSVSDGAGGLGSAPENVGRCIAALTANFDHELPRIPKAFRADATQVFKSDLAIQRTNWARKPPVGVNLETFSLIHGGAGGVGGDCTAARVEQGECLPGGQSLGNYTTSMVGIVPDGVASVTLHYNAGPLGGYSHKQVTRRQHHNQARQQRLRRPRSAPLRQRRAVDHHMARRQRKDHQDNPRARPSQLNTTRAGTTAANLATERQTGPRVPFRERARRTRHPPHAPRPLSTSNRTRAPIAPCRPRSAVSRTTNGQQTTPTPRFRGERVDGITHRSTSL
jgi:hypothetical protein